MNALVRHNEFVAWRPRTFIKYRPRSRDLGYQLDAHVRLYRQFGSLSKFRQILVAAHQEYGVSARDIIGRTRLSDIAHARQIAMWRAHAAMPRLSLNSIGRLFGGRHHTTVLHAIRKIDRLIASGEIVP